MATRLNGPPVIVGTHRGAWWRDAYGTLIACDDCDVVTARSRKDVGSIRRSFRLRHTRAAKLPPYEPRHAAPPERNKA